MRDADLLRQFEDLSLPYEDWTHRAHVRVAFLYLRDNPFEVALENVRTGIQAYNAKNTVAEGPTEGYNETTTHAFLRLVDTTMQSYGEAFPTKDSNEFCDTHPQLLTRHILRLFYSPARRMHPDAKTRFIEPDLAPLPRMMR